MCKRLLNISNENCGLAANFTTAHISRHISEVSWRLVDIKNYTLIFLFGFAGIFLLIYKSKLISKIFSYNFNLLLILILCSLPGLLLFYIAVDSGRWTSMLYHMLAISYFGMVKLKFVKINPSLNFRFINFDNIKNNFLFYLLIFLLCFGWSPKAVYHESFGTFPAYRMIVKTPKFFDNFKKPDHIFHIFF
jgi:hypothetical protein